MRLNYGSYLMTIRKHRVKEYVSFGDLQHILDTLIHYDVLVDDHCFESHGKYKQLHCHALVRITSNQKVDPQFITNQYEGFIIHFKRIRAGRFWLKHFQRAREYVHKHCDNHNPEQVEQTRMCNYFKYHYGF